MSWFWGAIPSGAGGPPAFSITSVTPSEFDFDAPTVDVVGTQFGATQGTGTVYVSPSSTLAGPGEVYINDAIVSWSDTLIELDFSLISEPWLSDLEAMGPGPRYLIVYDGTSSTLGYPITLHRAKAFDLSASTNVTASGENTTAQLTPPAGKTTADFGGGRLQDDENPGDTVNIDLDEYREDEWSIVPTARAVIGKPYEFRVYPEDSAPGALYVHPQIVIVPAVSTQLISVGVASESETAQAIFVDQITPVGVASESESAQVVVADQVIDVATAAESETANQVALDLSTLVSVASESESAQAVVVAAGERSVSIGITSEAELAVSIAADQTISIGTASESEASTGIAVIFDQSVLVVSVSELEIARAVSIAQAVFVGLTSELEAAQVIAVIFDQSLLVGVSTELEQANVVTPNQTVSVGAVSESESAGTVGTVFDQFGLIDAASEQESAHIVQVDFDQHVGMSQEFEAAEVVTPVFGVVSIVVGLASESENANAIAADQIIAVNTVSESETAGIVAPDQFVVVTSVFESETAGVISADQIIPVGTASEAETANTIDVLGQQTRSVGVVTELEQVESVSPIADQTIQVGTVLESESVHEVLAGRRIVVGPAAESETVHVIGIRLSIGTSNEDEVANLVGIIAGAADQTISVDPVIELELANAIVSELLVFITSVIESETAGSVAEVVGQAVITVGVAFEVEFALTVLYGEREIQVDFQSEVGPGSVSSVVQIQDLSSVGEGVVFSTNKGSNGLTSRVD